MMGTVEDFYPIIKKMNLDVSNTVIINDTILQSYLGNKFDPNNLTENQIAVGKVIVHETEHLKQQKILDYSGMNISLYTLFWKDNNPTMTNKLLEALADARLDLNTTPRYKGEIIQQAIDPSTGKNTSYTRLSQIYVLYMILMDKLDKNQKLEKTEAQKLVKDLQDLNKTPTKEELKLLNRM